MEIDTNRVRVLKGLPIETLQSIQALDQARREYLRSLVDYNAAQFRLQRAFGWPAEPMKLPAANRLENAQVEQDSEIQTSPSPKDAVTHPLRSSSEGDGT